MDFDIFSHLGLGFSVAFSPVNLGLCLIGALVGTLVGVLPGIGTIATVAMLLPITFGLPPVGALIIRKDVKVAVNQPIPRDLWNWMVLSGWRTIPVKKDRRKSMELPAGALLELISAHPTERDMVHARILPQAREQRA